MEKSPQKEKNFFYKVLLKDAEEKKHFLIFENPLKIDRKFLLKINKILNLKNLLEYIENKKYDSNFGEINFQNQKFVIKKNEKIKFFISFGNQNMKEFKHEFSLGVSIPFKININIFDFIIKIDSAEIVEINNIDSIFDFFLSEKLFSLSYQLNKNPFLVKEKMNNDEKQKYLNDNESTEFREIEADLHPKEKGLQLESVNSNYNQTPLINNPFNLEIEKNDEKEDHIKNRIRFDSFDSKDIKFLKRPKNEIKNNINIDIDLSSCKKTRLKKLIKIKEDSLKSPKKEEKLCVICLEEEKELKAKINSCGHIFCFDCLIEWTKITNLCPLCKTEFNFIKKFHGKDFIDKIKIKKKTQIIEEYVDPEIENAESFCYVCRAETNSHLLLVCDHCSFKCCHIFCLDPPLEFIPEDDWICDYCVTEQGVQSNNPIANININNNQNLRNFRNRRTRRIETETQRREEERINQHLERINQQREREIESQRRFERLEQKENERQEKIRRDRKKQKREKDLKNKRLTNKYNNEKSKGKKNNKKNSTNFQKTNDYKRMLSKNLKKTNNKESKLDKKQLPKYEPLNDEDETELKEFIDTIYPLEKNKKKEEKCKNKANDEIDKFLEEFDQANNKNKLVNSESESDFEELSKNRRKKNLGIYLGNNFFNYF